jgi:hypothetical protein
MKKVRKIDTKNIKKMVKEHFSEDHFSLPEHKIDSIIREYLFERNENIFTEEKTNFSPKSIDAIEDMILNLSEIADDLDVIKEKEGDILLSKNRYTDEILENYVLDISKLIKGLSDIVDITKQNKSNKDF